MSMNTMTPFTNIYQSYQCGNGRSPQQPTHAATTQATNCRTPKGSKPEIGLLPFSLSSLILSYSIPLGIEVTKILEVEELYTHRKGASI